LRGAAVKSRKLKLDKNFEPLPTRAGDEIFRNGYFEFNITRILEDISAGCLRQSRNTQLGS